MHRQRLDHLSIVPVSVTAKRFLVILSTDMHSSPQFWCRGCPENLWRTKTTFASQECGVCLLLFCNNLVWISKIVVTTARPEALWNLGSASHVVDLIHTVSYSLLAHVSDSTSLSMLFIHSMNPIMHTIIQGSFARLSQSHNTCSCARVP